jgi:chromosomal replication initiation ATPase DnaA
MKVNANYFCYPGTVHVLVGTKDKNPREVIDTIFAVVEMSTGICKFEILAKDRTRKVKEARQLFHYLADEMTTETLTSIGQITKRSHCTVIHSLKVVEGVMSYNKKLFSKVDAMKNEITRRVNVETERRIVNN